MRVGPVPTDWSFGRVKDVLFQIGQVDVAFVRIGADGMVLASYRDGTSAETAACALNGRFLVSGGPAISASVVTHRLLRQIERKWIGWA